MKAQTILKNFGVKIDVWSITSFNELYRDGIKSDRALRLNQESNKSYVQECFEQSLPTIAVSEYQRSYADQIRKWVNGEYVVLGTVGLGRSYTREKLRDFFEISTEHLIINALYLLGKIVKQENL